MIKRKKSEMGAGDMPVDKLEQAKAESIRQITDSDTFVVACRKTNGDVWIDLTGDRATVLMLHTRLAFVLMERLRAPVEQEPQAVVQGPEEEQ